MSTKHTLGPWSAKPAGCFVDADGKPTTPPSEFRIDPIMGRLLVGNVSVARREADARLIAAAPELLEAVAGLLAILRDNELDDPLDTRIRHASAAIAKATGSEA